MRSIGGHKSALGMDSANSGICDMGHSDHVRRVMMARAKKENIPVCKYNTRDKRTGAILKRQGVKAGIPDITNEDTKLSCAEDTRTQSKRYEHTWRTSDELV